MYLKRISVLWIFLLFNGCSSPKVENYPKLEEKLENHIKLMDKAKEEILHSNPNDLKEMNNLTIENMFESDSKLKITELDLQILKKRESEIINHAYLVFSKRSEIDLQKLRKNREIRQKFCREFPKGGLLHIHLLGTMKRPFIKNRLLKLNPVLDKNEIFLKTNDSKRSMLFEKEISFVNKIHNKRFKQLSNKDQNTLIDFFFLKPSKIPYQFMRFQAAFGLNFLLKGADNLNKEILLDFLKRAKSHNVDYVEFTKEYDPTQTEWLDVKKMTSELKKETGIDIRWNVAFIRDKNSTENSERAKKLAVLIKKNESILPYVGIDLLANEEKTSFLTAGSGIYPYISKIKKMAHAGEHGDIFNVRNAILFGAERIGHGVLLQEDLPTLEYVRKKGIGIDINLSSNVYLGVVNKISEHPFLKYSRLGIPVSLSTDDEGIFNTDISKECELAVKETNITYQELKNMSINSLENSFAENDLKKNLKTVLMKKFIPFEKKWKKLFSNPN